MAALEVRGNPETCAFYGRPLFQGQGGPWWVELNWAPQPGFIVSCPPREALPPLLLGSHARGIDR